MKNSPFKVSMMISLVLLIIFLNTAATNTQHSNSGQIAAGDPSSDSEIAFENRSIPYQPDLIRVIDAKIFDNNDNFIADVLEQVSERDRSNFTLNPGDRLDIKFEKKLNAANDITIYGSSIYGSPRVDVYTKGSETPVMTFDNIIDYQEYKKYLTGLKSEEDEFEIRVSGGTVNIDQIIDPALYRYCYQENATNATSCGGLSTGNYSSNFSNSNWRDGDWATSTSWSGVGLGGDFSYINYSKPIGATNNSKWQYGLFGVKNNASIPSSCWAYSSSTLFVRIILNFSNTCLAANTIITTADGDKIISDLMIGDYVLSRNNITGSNEYKRVTKVYSRDIKVAGSRYYNISFINTYDESNNPIQNILATWNHLFYIDGNYQKAVDLKVGDIFTNEQYNKIKIVEISVIDNEVDTVWDIEVEDNHNFFANGILVHNWDGYGTAYQCYNGAWTDVFTYGDNVVDEEAMWWDMGSGPYTLTYTTPTLPNTSTTSWTNISINISLDAAHDLGKIIYRLNKTNYTLYNNSLLLYLNFNNYTTLGENKSKFADISASNRSVSCDWSTAKCPNLTTASYRNGYALIYNANVSNQFVNTSLIKGNGSITYAAWIYPTLAASYPMIISDQTGTVSERGCEMRLYAGTAQPEFFCGGGGVVARSATALTLNQWAFVVGTWNGTYFSMNVNGIEKATGAYSTYYNASDTAVLVGQRPLNVGSYPFKGTIDQAMVWNRSLSKEEIQILYMSQIDRINSTHWDIFVNQTWNATNVLTNGSYSFQFVAFDNASNFTASENRTVIVNSMHLTNCSTLEISNAHYDLKNNISNYATTCFTIAGNNVTLDGNGFFVDGQEGGGSYGIYGLSRKNITIKNITLNNFDTGLYLSNVNDSSIINISFNLTGDPIVGGTAYSAFNSGSGYYADCNNYHTVHVYAYKDYYWGRMYSTAMTATYDDPCDTSSYDIYWSWDAVANVNGYEIYKYDNARNYDYYKSVGNTTSHVDDNSNWDFIGVEAIGGKKSNSYGAYLLNSNNNTVINADASYNLLHGIWLQTSNNNTVSYSRIKGNQQYGLYVQSSSNNNFTSINVTQTSYYGIYALTNSNNNRYTDINSSNNSQRGILTSACSNNNFTRILTESNLFYGFYMASGANNTVNNLTTRSSQYGLTLSATSNNSFYNLTAVSNSVVGLYVLSSGYNNSFFNSNITLNPTDYSQFSGNGNETRFNDSMVGKYSITSAATLRFINSTAGEIKFLNSISGASSNLFGNSSSDIVIKANYAYVNSSVAGLNKSANVTLFGVPVYGNPVILRNGSFPCNSSTTPACINFTPLTAGTVKFNVTSWSNYSIGPSINLTDCGTLSTANTVYTLLNDIYNHMSGSCFSITADNITLDGNDKIIEGDNGYDAAEYYAITAVGRKNITIKNFRNITRWGNIGGLGPDEGGGIQFSSVNNSLIANITLKSNYHGIIMTGGGNNTIANLTIIYSLETSGASNAIELSSSSDNRFSNISSNSNANGFEVSGNRNIFINSSIINSSQNAIIIIGTSSDNNTFQNVSISTTNSLYRDLLFSSTGINGTKFRDMPQIRNYSFTGNGGKITFNRTDFGEIKFLNNVSGSGLNFTLDIVLGSNTAYVNSSRAGLNVSANITLLGVPSTYIYPTILKDGQPCLAPLCNNFTSLTAGTVMFNVTSWSNYTIGDANLSSQFVQLSPTEGQTLQTQLVNLSVSTSGITNRTYSFFRDGLVAWYRMDNSTTFGENNTYVYDWSGNRNNLSCATGGCPTSNYSAAFGTTKMFDGSNDEFTSINSASLTITSSFTVSTWVYMRAYPGAGKFPDLIGKHTDWTGYGLYYNGASGITPLLGNSGVWYSTSHYIPPLFEWHLVTTTFNDSNLSLFVDGAYYSSAVSPAPSADASGLTIARHYSAPASFGWLNASLDEMMIFNRSLSPTEIKSLYNSTQHILHRNMTLAGGSYNYTVMSVDMPGNLFNTSRGFSISARFISACGTLSTSNTEYELVNNIINSAATCFDVAGSNITLDGNGYYLDGDDGGGNAGISITGRRNVTIKNITINDFAYGIYLVGTHNSNITNVSFNLSETEFSGTMNVYSASGGGTDYYADCGNYHEVHVYSYKNYPWGRLYSNYGSQSFGDPCDASDYSIYWSWDSLGGEEGFRVYKFDNVPGRNFDAYIETVSNDHSDGNYFPNSGTEPLIVGKSSNDYGIYLANSHNNTISNVDIGFSQTYGIMLTGSSNNTITGSRITETNNGRGINIISGKNNTLSKLNVSSNTYGIYLDTDTNETKLYDINSSANTYGIYVSSGYRNRFERINSTDSSGGLAFSLSRNNTVVNFTAISTGISIELYYSDNNTFINSSGILSTSYGLYGYGSRNNTFVNLNASSAALYDLNILLYDLNNTLFNNSVISRFNIGIPSKLRFVNSSYGEITFTDAISGTGTELFGRQNSSIRIGNNLAYINSSISGLNKAANITLYGVSAYTNAVILRNGTYVCNSTTTPSCYNFTPLTAGTVRFNVSSWSNYSIGQSINLTECGTLSAANSQYTMLNNIIATSTCFNITADNITLNGNNKLLNLSSPYNNSVYGVIATSARNVTIKNLNVSYFVGTSDCYQESANVSSACGGLSTGIYWNSASGGLILIDGDWSTGYGIANNDETQVNYTKPAGAMNSSLWQIKDSGGTFNLSIPATCWNYNPTKLILRMQSLPMTCLDADTLIDVPGGTAKISDIKIGDLVLSYNASTNSTEYNKVINVRNQSIALAGGKYYVINYNSGMDNIQINATWNHEFYSNGTYVLAKDLIAGDMIKDSLLRDVEIMSIEVVNNYEDQVWDITVENSHTFFANGILVHNWINYGGIGGAIWGCYNGTASDPWVALSENGVGAVLYEEAMVWRLPANFSAGIKLSNTNRSYIQNVTLINNSNNLIVENSNQNNIGNLTSHTSYASGIYVVNSSHNNLSTGTLNGSMGDAILIGTLASNNSFASFTITNVVSTSNDFEFGSGMVNGTRLIDMTNTKNYSFTGNGGIISIVKTGIGEIKYLSNVSGSGRNLSSDIQIGANSAYINSSKPGLNTSANITFYSMSASSGASILRNGAVCDSTTTPSCYNLTLLTASTVVFNVSQSGNYTIGVGSNLTTCGVLSVSNIAYTLMNNINDYDSGYCFTITASNVSFNGNGKTIDGYGDVTGTNYYGISVSNARNVTIYNVNLTDWGDSGYIDSGAGGGIYFTNSNYSTIRNSNVTRSLFGIVFDASSNNTIINTTANYNSEIGLWIGPNSNSNNFTNITSQWVTNNAIQFDANSNYNKVRNSTFTNSNTYSISINGNYNLFDNITSTSNTYGITLGTATGNTLSNISMNRNQNSIQLLSGANNNNFSRVNINGSTGHAIYMTTTSKTENNTFNNLSITNTSSAFADVFANTAGINNTAFVDTAGIKNYSFAGLGSRITVRNSSVGEIKFLNPVNGSGRNLSMYIQIKNNFVYVNSSQTGLNISANVTLYGVTAYSNPVIFRDGTSICNSTTTPACYNFTPLTAGTVIFNVSSWSNYSIGPSLNLTECGTLNVAGANYIMTRDITMTTSPCFNFDADNITFDGRGFIMNDGGANYDAFGTTGSRHNVTIKDVSINMPYQCIVGSFTRSMFRNVTCNGGANGFYISSSYTYIHNNTIYGSGGDILALQIDGDYNNLTNNRLFSNSGYAVVLQSGSDQNNISNNNISSNTNAIAIQLNGNLNRVINNTIELNAVGIELQSGSGSNTVSLNRLKDNTQAISVVASNNNNFSYNNISNTSGAGLYINAASNNNFTGGLINSSKTNAIYIYMPSSSGNNFTNISIMNTNRSFSDLNFSQAGINNTHIIDMYTIYNYSFTGNGGRISVVKSGVGEIEFRNPVNLSGYNFTRDIQINNNFVYVNSSQTGLNRSANVTLYGVPGYANPAIYRDGTSICNTSTTPACYNMTPLNAGTVVFNVSSWSNYSIGENYNLSDCAILNISNSVYRLMNSFTLNQNGDNCFQIKASNITFDGNWYQINVNTGVTYPTIIATDAVKNITIRNFNLQGNAEGATVQAILLGASNSSIYNIIAMEFDGAGSGAISIGGNNNTISNVTASYNDNDMGGFGLLGTNNTLMNVSSNYNSLGVLIAADYNRITNSTFNMNTDGIVISFAKNNTIINNTINGTSTFGNALIINSVAINNSFINITITNTIGNGIDLFVAASANGTLLQDIRSIKNYTIYGIGALLTVMNSSIGEIKFLNTVNGSGQNFTKDVYIRSNSVYVNSSRTGLNRSANITLYGVPVYSNPVIFRDGTSICNSSTVPACYNFTPLTAGTVRFNVSSWSNYSIGPSVNLTECGTLSSANTTYTLLNDIYFAGDCFIIAANGIVINGNGKRLTGDGTSSGVTAIDRLNLTVKNITIDQFNYGLYISNTNNSAFVNNSLASYINSIYIVNSYYNRIFGSNTTDAYDCGGTPSINIESSRYINVTDNNISSCTGAAIGLTNSNLNNILRNNATGGNNFNIVALNGASNNTIANNSIWISGSSGILIVNSANNNISGGMLGNSTDSAIIISGVTSANNTFTNVNIGNTSKLAYDIYITTANINGTHFVDMPAIGNYSFYGLGSAISIVKSGLGEIQFINPANLSGYNLSRDIQISSNFVFVNSSQTGLNKSANITLYNVPVFGNPTIYKDGNIVCNATTSPSCYNFTRLDSGTVLFNVSSWSNYSIGPATNLSLCGQLHSANTTYTLTSNILVNGTCFTLTAQNITINGNGYNLTGNTTGFGVTSTAPYASSYSITVINLTVRNFSTDLSSRGYEYLPGFEGGDITVINSTVWIINASGGNAQSNGHGGDSGNVLLNGSTVRNIFVNGGEKNGVSYYGGHGGNVTLYNSAAEDIYSILGATNNNVTGTIIAMYSNISGIMDFRGYLLQNLIFINSNINLTTGDYLYSSQAGNRIVNLSGTNSFSNSFGKIEWKDKFFNLSSGSHNITYQVDIKILNNSAYVNTSKIEGLNVTTNVTFYGVPSYSNPVIYRNSSIICTSTTTPACYNYTLLTAGTVKFNVTIWNESIYSIGESLLLTQCTELNTSNRIYTLQNSITNYPGTCFNVTANNVTINGNGFTIDGDDGGTDYGIVAIGKTNITVINFAAITDFYTGILFSSTSQSKIANINSISSNTAYGILLNQATSNNITNVTISTHTYSMYLSSSSNYNNLRNITSTLSQSGFYLSFSSRNNFTNITTTSNTITGITLDLSDYNSFTNFSSSFDFRALRIGYSPSNNFTNGAIISPSENAIIVVSDSNANNQFTNISITGTGAAYHDINFTSLWNNGTHLVDMQNIKNYSFYGIGSRISVVKSGLGEIDFINLVNGTGYNFTRDIQIANNFVFVNSSQTGINRSANVTLYGVAVYTNPAILRDGTNVCNATTTPSCYNFTPLTAGTVRFNVSGWSNYTIGQSTSLVECGTLGVANTVYSLSRSITNYPASCFNITANNITLNGNGYILSGTDNVSSYGIYLSGRLNITIKNFAGINNFYSGIYMADSSNNNTIVNITLDSNYNGIELRSSINNTFSNISANSGYNGVYALSANHNIISNTSTYSNYEGIYIISSHNNTFNNIISNGNTYSIDLLSSLNNNLTNISISSGVVRLATSSHNKVFNLSLTSHYILLDNSANNSFNYGTISLSAGDAIGLTGTTSTNNSFINLTISSSGTSTRDLVFSTAGINGTQLIDMPGIKNYSFTGNGGTLIIRKSGVGEIRFLKNISGSGYNLSRDISVTNNSASVNSSQLGLNQSANITFYGMPTNYNNPVILRNGTTVCSPSTTPACYNLTLFNAGTVVFNVSSWTNYSIDEHPFVAFVAFLLTLPGSAPVNGTNDTPTGTMFFNSTTNTNYNVEPCVESTTNCQNGTSPFFVYSNVGNVNLTVQLYLDSNLSSVFGLKAGTTNISANAVNVTTTRITIAANITPGSNQSVFFYGDYINAYPTDSQARNLTSLGNQS